jgi:hypothetical protein
MYTTLNLSAEYIYCSGIILRMNVDYTNKGSSVTRREGSYGYETSRLPHFLDNRLIDCCKVVSLTCRPPFTPQEDSWYSFLLEAESTPGP